jgi:membrane protein
LREVARAFAEHNLLTYAAAIAFQALVALVPLTLLALGLLGAIGLEGTWSDSLAPAIEKRVTQPVFHGVDFSVKRILAHGDAGLIAFAALLALWYLAAAMRAVMEALNKIHDVDDRRSWRRRAAVSVALAVASGLFVVGSALIVSLAPRAGGALHVLLGIGRWIVSALLLGLLVAVLVRFAPAEHPQPRWASAGSVVIVCSWIVESLLFRLWVTSVANFKSPIGSLTAVLVLTGYLFLASIIFLAGVQLDELLRKGEEASGRRRSG